MTFQDWLPGLVAATAGIAVGTGLLLRARSGPFLPSPDVAERIELERQRDLFYSGLRELEVERDRMEPERLEAERYRLELEAAKVLKGLDALMQRGTAVAPKIRPGIGEQHPRLVGALWATMAMLFLGAIGLGLQQYSAPRTGGSVTGNGQSGGMGGGMGGTGGTGDGTGAPVQLDPITQQACTEAEKNPADIAKLNLCGHGLMRADRMMEAWKLSEQVVAIESDNIEARTHQGIILIAINETAMAKAILEKVIAMQPDMVEALSYRGLLHMREGEADRAIALWERVIAIDPTQTEAMAPLIQMAKNPSAGMPPQIAGAGGAGGAGAGAGGAGAGAGGAVTGGPGISGEIRLDQASAGKIPAGGAILFISARAASTPPGQRGPPLAAKRIPIKSAADFPVVFNIGPGDSPMGGGLSGELVLTARIDSDGDPVSRSPEDLEGKSGALTAGTETLTGVVITIQ